MSSNSKKGAKRKRNTQVSSAGIAEEPLCTNCRGRGNTKFVNTHDTAFCAYTGGNYDGRFADAKKAARAAKAAESARKIRKAGQPTEIEREVEILKEGLLHQSQIVSDAEKRIGSVVKQMEKLQKRIEQLEWDNHQLTEQNWKCDNELQQWKDWYNNSFDGDLDSWFFDSFAFSQQGLLSIKTSPALARYKIQNPNAGFVIQNTNTGYG